MRISSVYRICTIMYLEWDCSVQQSGTCTVKKAGYAVVTNDDNVIFPASLVNS